MEETRESTEAAVRGMMAEEETEAARGGESSGKKMKVVVAVDGSEESMHALGWALDHLFTATRGLPDTAGLPWTLVVLHVQPPVHVMMQPVGPAPVICPAVYALSSEIESAKKAQEQKSATVLSAAVQLCKERLVEAQTLIIEGDAKHAICQAAEEVHADLLVVGSRGLSTLRRAFLGSVSDYVAHHAICPVLIVRPQRAHHKHETAGKAAV